MGELDALYYFRAAYVRGDRSRDTCICLALALEAVGWVSMAEKIRAAHDTHLSPLMMRFEEKIWISIEEVYSCLERPVAKGAEPSLSARDAARLRSEMSKRSSQPLKPVERGLIPSPSSERGKLATAMSRRHTPVMPKLPEIQRTSPQRGHTQRLPKLPNITERRLSKAPTPKTSAPKPDSAQPPIARDDQELAFAREAARAEATARGGEARGARRASPLRALEALSTQLASALGGELEVARADAAPRVASKPADSPRADYRTWGHLQRSLSAKRPHRPKLQPKRAPQPAPRRYLLEQTDAFALSSEAIKPYLDEEHLPLDPPLPAEALRGEVMVRITNKGEQVWVKGMCRSSMGALGAECDQLQLQLSPDVRAWLMAR